MLLYSWGVVSRNPVRQVVGIKWHSLKLEGANQEDHVGFAQKWGDPFMILWRFSWGKMMIKYDKVWNIITNYTSWNLGATRQGDVAGLSSRAPGWSDLQVLQKLVQNWYISSKPIWYGVPKSHTKEASSTGRQRRATTRHSNTGRYSKHERPLSCNESRRCI